MSPMCETMWKECEIKRETYEQKETNSGIP